MEANVHALAYDEQAVRVIGRVARSQYKRRRRAYEEVAILSPNDLEQTLWLRLLVEQERGRFITGFVSCEQSFADYLISLAEMEAVKGRRRAKHGHSLPLSSLSKRDKHKLWHKRGFSLEATFDELFERPEHWG